MLKAHVTEATKEFPAKTHDLIYLVKYGKIMLPQDMLEFIGKINTSSIPTRYPEDLQQAIQEYPEPIARDYLENTEKVLTWLKKNLNPS